MNAVHLHVLCSVRVDSELTAINWWTQVSSDMYDSVHVRLLGIIFLSAMLPTTSEHVNDTPCSEKWQNSGCTEPKDKSAVLVFLNQPSDCSTSARRDSLSSIHRTNCCCSGRKKTRRGEYSDSEIESQGALVYLSACIY